MIYPQEIEAADNVIKSFMTFTYVILFALMQSGKTNTFKLVGCEMKRLGHIRNIVIFTGNREVQLRTQTSDNTEFIESYKQYLASKQIQVNDLEFEAITAIQVLAGQDLKGFKPKSGKTLYIWDESHYGQTDDQQVDKFLAKIGMQANGEMSNDNFILSVSATPFAELSDFIHHEQPKKIVRLIPSPSYISVESLKRSKQLKTTSVPIKTLRELLSTPVNGYGLIRATEKKQKDMEPLTIAAGWDVIKFDMESEVVDINTILTVCPSKPTIIFIKGKCRMGKRIIKTHLLFGMETSKSKTDTLLQGLLGRWCGYVSHPFAAPIYITKLNEKEIDNYIACFNGDFTCIPEYATNIKKQKISVRRVTIPCRVKCESATNDVATDILGSLTNGKLENHNDPTLTDSIVRLIQTLCAAREKPAATRNPAEKVLVKNYFRFHECNTTNERQKQKHSVAFARIQHAFTAKEEQSYGSDYGVASTEQESLIAWRPRGTTDIYFYMFIDRHEERPVPVTSGKEIFKTINQDDEDEDEDDDEDKCNEFIVPHYNEDFMLE
jgi:hypothetical protein